MAKTILPIAGAVVGAFVGMPQLGFAVGSLLAAAIPTTTQGPRIGDTGPQTSMEGSPRAIVYGVAEVTGNLIATGPLIKGEQVQGGKGGDKVSTEIGIRTYAIRICEGPIAGVTRIWEDDKLVYDIRPGSLILAESQKWFFGCGIYLGTETQMPDSFLNSQVPPHEHPAHRGTAYMVFVGRDLTQRAGSIPQYRFEVANTVSTVTLPMILNSGTKWVDSVAGALAAFQDFTVTNRLLPSPTYDASVSKLTLTASGDPTVTYSATFYFGGGEVLNVNFTGSGTYVVQLNPGILQVSYDFKVHNPDGVTRNMFFSIDIVWPNPAYASVSRWVAYSNTTIGNTTLPTDPYYGVIQDGAGNVAAATWGPASITQVGGSTTLDAVVKDIQDRCTVPAANYSVAELAGIELDGFVLAGDYTGSSAIDALRQVYFFDKAEYDKKLWYPLRGKAVVLTLDIDDLVDIPDFSTREQSLEFPKKLHLQYQHAASGYAIVTQTVARSSPDVRVTGETTVQTPVVMDENQAAQTADKMLKVSWAEAEGDTVISVPDSFIGWVPSDCFGLSLRGSTRRYRLETSEYADGVLKWTMRVDRQSAYTSNLTGVPIPPPSLPPPTLVGETTLAVLDIPSRQDTEDDLNIYYGITGNMPAWYGATVQRSLDGGASYSNVVSGTSATIMGTLVAAVADADEAYTDTTNTVIVSLIRPGQELESISETTFRSEGGAFALENADGSYEVMQYRDCHVDSAGDFHLSHLTRGRLNTVTNAHAAGALFVMMDSILHVPTSSSMIGQAMTHRAPSTGESPSLAATQTQTYVGRSQLEWPVASLTLARSGSNIVTGTWAPRHRFGTDDAPVASVNFTGYRITIVGTSTVVLPDQTATSFSYDASALGTTVTVSVQALNRITGAGPSRSGTI